jgi:23S rRNA (adenine2503-C2)-methyltransferase
VLVPMMQGRTTLCVSSQVGCAMACRFCATGTLGLTRGLTSGEIIAQVHAARAWAGRQGRRVTRLVFMGMGEPLHHYEATRDALRVILDVHGLNYGSKNVTVSTVGLVPKMRRFADDFGGRVQLALSLHAGTDATRHAIVPTARGVSMAELRQALLDAPLPGTRKIMVEYVVLPGVNDSEDELEALAEWMHGIRGVVNLIPFNPFPGAPYRSPTTDEVMAVFDQLRAARVAASVRWPRGRGAHGACGQLALAHEETLRA